MTRTTVVSSVGGWPVLDFRELVRGVAGRKRRNETTSFGRERARPEGCGAVRDFPKPKSHIGFRAWTDGYAPGSFLPIDLHLTCYYVRVTRVISILHMYLNKFSRIELFILNFFFSQGR